MNDAEALDRKMRFLKISSEFYCEVYAAIHKARGAGLPTTRILAELKEIEDRETNQRDHNSDQYELKKETST